MKEKKRREEEREKKENKKEENRRTETFPSVYKEGSMESLRGSNKKKKVTSELYIERKIYLSLIYL